MDEEIKKALFHLEAEEFKKADELFSKVFEKDSNHEDALIGLVLSKVYEGNLKGAKAYFEKLEIENSSLEKRNFFKDGLLKAIKFYIAEYLKDLRSKANELSKRPALDGQLYTIKQLGDTTDHMDNINNAASDFESALNFSEIAYKLEDKNKEDIAFRILSLYDFIFHNIKETPQMQGKTLLQAKELSPLKNRRNDWKENAGKKGAAITSNPSDSSGCLLLISAITILSLFISQIW